MNTQQIIKIAVTVVVALVLLKIVSGILLPVTVPLIVLVVKIFRVLLAVAAILLILKFLGVGLKK